MDGPAFFARLARALKDNPPYATDKTAIKRLEQIGLTPGEDLDVDKMDAAVAKGLTRAAKKVWGTLEIAPYSMKTVNGWLVPSTLVATATTTRCVRSSPSSASARSGARTRCI
jgi:hypothetical protein